ncbi:MULTISPECIES: ATP-dependent DNA helicase [Clostridia]|uniref:ATP-dependent DNA helicase n=1 Tax=Clostridia TaxID=186801 RepID=UPI00067EC6AD|nr:MULTISPECIES: ATP-dependent DNA helicase [Clostridia]
MFYKNQFQKKAHGEVETIFRKLLPAEGLNVREEQIELCHTMLDSLLYGKIALCDAGVGIGKTYAYLIACILMRKYAILSGKFVLCDSRPVVISTSSIALQKAILSEYIPFLSKILTEHEIIQTPIRAIVRKGKEHFVCDSRLEQRLEAIMDKAKNAGQKQALLSLRHVYDLDEVRGLSGFDRRLVCVPKFCPKDCPGREGCRYQRYLKTAKSPEIFIQICNHNYLLADASHRAKAYRPLLADYRALVVDEAHQLPEAARQMYGRSLGSEEVREICTSLEKEHQKKAADRLREVFRSLLETLEENTRDIAAREDGASVPEIDTGIFKAALIQLEQVTDRLRGFVPRWTLNRLGEAEEVLRLFYRQDSNYIRYLQHDRERLPVLCATSRRVPRLLQEALWKQGFPAILTSGTLKAGDSFARTRQVTGLSGTGNVQEYVAKSPFAYKKNCLLYLPKTLKPCRRGSREEVVMLAKHIQSLICSTYGHTLVLFTSYSLMGSVYQMVKDSLPFPMVEVWRHSQEEIARFKTLENAVLFAAGSCWEGVDFPGDMVSSLIIVKLPFAVPNPISEAEKERYETLGEYIQAVIVPDMQKKLRQGFGRAIRTEQDTCVVSILDSRAIAGGRYHQEVLCALPDCQRAENLKAVECFIRSRKGTEYYM